MILLSIEYLQMRVLINELLHRGGTIFEVMTQNLNNLPPAPDHLRDQDLIRDQYLQAKHGVC